MANDHDDQSDESVESEPTMRRPPDQRYESNTDSVRIIGAEPADPGRVGATPPSDTGHGEDELDSERRAVRYSDSGETWSASGEGEPASPADAEPPVDDASGDSAELPHWSEPPTAEMAALGSDRDSDDDWASFTGSAPRFRSGSSDWEDPDWGDLDSEGAKAASLSASAAAAAQPRAEDSDEAFAAAVTRRRGGSRRPARTQPAVGHEPESGPVPGGGRDLPTALATAGIVIVVALLAFNAGTFWTALLVCVITALASVEFTQGLRAGGFRPAVPLALVASAALPIAAREYGLPAIVAFSALVVVFSLLWFLWEVSPGRPIGGVASTVFAFAYIGLLGGFAGLLLGAEHGIGLLLGAVICTVSYDVVGFFVGSQFGKSPVAPRISPNKTVEGTLAGMAASILLGLLVVGRIYPWNGSKGLVLGILVALGAFLGDLSESMMKRDLGVKDFGTLLPGHGGVLDRFDSMLFALPITFYIAIQFDIFI